MRTHMPAAWCALATLVTSSVEQNPIKAEPYRGSGNHPGQQDAWFALLFAHATVTERIDRELQQQHRISFSATEILCRLHDEEPQSVRSLAGRLVSVSPTRASRLVQELVDAGYLRRGADQGDGRKSLISFTSEGRRYSEEVARTLERRHPPVLRRAPRRRGHRGDRPNLGEAAGVPERGAERREPLSGPRRFCISRARFGSGPRDDVGRSPVRP